MTASAAAQPDPSALWNALSVQQRTVLQRAAASAAEEGGEAFLVGGPVRDLLRGDVRLHDIDVVTSTDARPVARRFAAQARAEIAKTTEFGTATVHLFDDNGGITRVDFATARIESYPRPGALPVVTFPASITADLHRRDVTINAMALPITPDGFGALLDPTGGLADLRRGIIRILHDASFCDDPTRLYRAARYAARFAFIIEPHTSTLLRAAIADGALTTISADRKRHELELGLREANPVACFAAFNVYGLLLATSSTLIWDDWVAARIPLVAPTAWPVWAFFVCRQDDTAVEQLLADVPMGGMQPIRRLVRVWRERDIITNAPRLSAFRPLLDKLYKRDVLAVLHEEPSVQRAEAYYERLSHISRQDRRWGKTFAYHLIQLGVTPGPAYGEILGALRDARLDGDVETREEAEDFVRSYLGEHNSTS